MRSRIAAAVALAATVMLGATGCNLISPQDTTIHYDPSDGVSADLGLVQVRNLFVVSDDAGLGNVVFVAVNSDSKEATLFLEVRSEGDPRIALQIALAPGLNQFGFGEFPQVLLEGLGSVAGQNIELYLQSGSAEGVLQAVPMLNNAFSEYSELLPTPAPVAPEALPELDDPALEAEATS